MSKNTVDIANALLAGKAALEARVKELEESRDQWKANAKEFNKSANKLDIELARLKTQEPIYQMRLLDGSAEQMEWVEVTSEEYSTPTKSHEWERRKVYAEPRPAVLPDKDTIREVFMRNGFTIKEGQTDLKDYVYAAATDLLALGCPPQRFVVKLPEEHGTVFIGGVGVRVFSEPSIIEALKAAGGEIAE